MNTGEADTHLAVYGTLAPGEPNHHVVADLGGHWTVGTVCGVLHQAGWGSELGYPGIHLDAAGPAIEVSVLFSPMLPDHWKRLDAFEGPQYRRTPVVVSTAEGDVTEFIYELV